ncbi:hypothetical protein K438DRAFT_1960392 [Mycena galopus ATCC 62051]|nr:hypothetical protein K438DRAFT_1960392 [Mycena galopus ATCC 62051]
MFDQPARDANGNLRDAADTEFYKTESDVRPLPTRSAGKTPSRRAQRANEKLTKYLATEKANNDGNPFIAH